MTRKLMISLLLIYALGPLDFSRSSIVYYTNLFKSNSGQTVLGQALLFSENTMFTYLLDITNTLVANSVFFKH
jgi:hypothetical protein